MEADNYIIKQFSQNSILITFKQYPSRNLTYFLSNLKNQLEDSHSEVILDVNYAYNSLLISYVYTIDNVYDEYLNLKECILASEITSKSSFRKIILPVCYDEKFGLDLMELSKRLKLSIPEIIYLHSSTEYFVSFLGFLPGFPYLDNLPKELHCPRRDTPRQNIEKGAVGIGGTQTGIYPQESPGGWQIIGNCPIDLFGNNWQNYTALKPTDILAFNAISLSEYELVKQQFHEGNYHINIEQVGAS